ncbi:SDR family oxidoreductase [Mariniblastus fucicola]|uniref:Serine 3-dehydrogenase n=1 Tax=Mariniblastus fucicola TaxID=980251 RepID=A0A5B9PCU5_9BACT|nr:SDR family oxidoreductase [Mariniblastus fucicola]QEG24104.1 Serine 3-dehydrogenase [Mariniblastus fucicola]
MAETSPPVCLVTGASSGIGYATAKRFLAEGYRVAICGRRPESLQSAANSLGNADHVLAISGDIGLVETRRRLVESTLTKFGRIDVLVNNAGAAPLGDFESIDESTFETVVSTNIRAVFSLTQMVWPTLKKQQRGSIVNISSMAAVDPFPGFSIYGASKAWLETFTKAIAAEGVDDAIRVCCVRPGAVETDLLRGLFPGFPADQCVRPDDIANKIWSCVADPVGHPSGEAFTVSK